MPEVIAYYIANSYYRGSMYEGSFLQHYNSAPITVVSSFMGHSNTTETLKTYSHLFKGKLNETMDIINNLGK